MSAAPIPCRYEGEGEFRAAPRFLAQADRDYVIGEIYLLEVIEERSSASHRHYFALVREAWLNLPFDAAMQFNSPEALRKYALIKAGYADAEVFVCEFKTEARRLAAALRCRREDFAIIVIDEKVVTRFTAKSQSMKAMGKEAFQASKDAVLGILADMIGVEPAALGRAA